MEQKRDLSLAILVAGLFVKTACDNKRHDEHAEYMRNRVEELQTQVESQKITVVKENVIGGSAYDTFYVIGGKRVFLEIDNVPIDQYILKPSAEQK